MDKKYTFSIILILLFFVLSGVVFLSYQLQQTEIKLENKTKENENLLKRIDELQKEIGELKNKEKTVEETANWKTYRNEEFGFEVDYFIDDWELNAYSSKKFQTCKKLTDEEKENIFSPEVLLSHPESLCISSEILFLNPECANLDWEKENAKNFSARAGECIIDLSSAIIKGVDFREKITTQSGIKGYQGNILSEADELKEFFLFPLKEKMVESEKQIAYPILWSYYYPHIFFPEEMSKHFNKIVSSFRYIEN